MIFKKKEKKEKSQVKKSKCTFKAIKKKNRQKLKVVEARK